jgi:DNA-binding MarR family transcriptional regulator
VSERRRRVPPARQAWQAVYDLLLFNPHAHDRMQRICEDAGFTPALMKAILSPSLQPGRSVPMRTLASEWRCDPSYVTTQIRDLEQRGLVERQYNPEDHRFKTVALTDKGERTRAEMRDRLLEPPEFFSVLSVSEQRTLRDLLDKLVAAAQATPPKARPAVPASDAEVG